MGCCLNRGGRNQVQARGQPESEKQSQLPMLSAKEDKPTDRPTARPSSTPLSVLKLERKPKVKEHPQMKVIYSKKIISKDDPESLLSQLVPPRGKTLLPEQAKAMELPGVSPGEQSPEVVKSPETGGEPSANKEFFKPEDSTSENYIEVNELNFLSELKKTTKQKPASPRKSSSSSPKNTRTRKLIDDQAKVDWNKQYNVYIDKQMADLKIINSFRGLNEFSVLSRPAFLILRPEDSATTSQPKGSVRSPEMVQNRQAPKSPLKVSQDANKFLLNSLRKRNQTAPDLNLLSNPGTLAQKSPPKITSGFVKISTLPNNSNFKCIPEESDSGGEQQKSGVETNNSKGVGSADSLTLPQFNLRRHLTPSVKSFQHSIKNKLNELHHNSNGVIIEQDSEENDESMNKDREFDKDALKTLSRKFVDLRNRNKTTAAPLNSSAQAFIFDTAKVQPPHQPGVRENSKIKETEDESNTSELLGDKLFKGLGSDSDVD